MTTGIAIIPVGEGFPARLLAVMMRHDPPLTQAKIRQDTGVSEKTIHRWLYGKTEPSAVHFYKVCQTYGWDAALLARYPENEPLLFDVDE